MFLSTCVFSSSTNRIKLRFLSLSFHFFFTIFHLASLESFDTLIKFIISSIFALATTKPIKMCALSLALFISLLGLRRDDDTINE